MKIKVITYWHLYWYSSSIFQKCCWPQWRKTGCIKKYQLLGAKRIVSKVRAWFGNWCEKPLLSTNSFAELYHGRLWRGNYVGVLFFLFPLDSENNLYIIRPENAYSIIMKLCNAHYCTAKLSGTCCVDPVLNPVRVTSMAFAISQFCGIDFWNGEA